MKPIHSFRSSLALLMALLLASPAQAWLFRDTYTETRYPIVLVHGMFGFDTLIGVDYWHGIVPELRRSGAQVHVAQVPALNSTEVRGEALARQVERILATTGASKVNLIGHSHGGPTSRYVASVYPQYVASVTSVGGVNWGARLADVLYGASGDAPAFGTTLYALGNALGGLIDLLSDGRHPQDMQASLRSLTTTETLAFNRRHPAGMPATYCGHGVERAANGVRYYSWSGASQVTNVLDPSDALMAAVSVVFNEKNDGLVSSCSSHLGRVIRDDYWMNHLDEINQFLGLHHLLATDPVTLYRQHANRLKQLGL